MAPRATKLAALGLKEEGEYADESEYRKERWRLCKVAKEEAGAAYDDLCDDDPHSEPPSLPAFYRNMCGFVGVPLPEAAA